VERLWDSKHEFKKKNGFAGVGTSYGVRTVKRKGSGGGLANGPSSPFGPTTKEDPLPLQYN